MINKLAGDEVAEQWRVVVELEEIDKVAEGKDVDSVPPVIILFHDEPVPEPEPPQLILLIEFIGHEDVGNAPEGIFVPLVEVIAVTDGAHE